MDNKDLKIQELEEYIQEQSIQNDILDKQLQETFKDFEKLYDYNQVLKGRLICLHRIFKKYYQKMEGI